MEDNAKIQVTATGEKLLVGSDYHVLMDKSYFIMEAPNPSALNTYLRTLTDGLKIFIEKDSIEAYGIALPILETRFITPLAKCRVTPHPILRILKDANGRRKDVQEFNHLLDILMPYSKDSALELKSNIENLNMKKVLSVERQIDQAAGNFVYAVRAEKAGNQDYEFPKAVVFDVPVIAGEDELTVEIEFNFYFRWNVEAENVNLTFMIENIELDYKLDIALMDCLVKSITPGPKDLIFIGRYNKNLNDDSWKYKRNEANL